MSSFPTKFHIFKEKNFQGLVYCDYCEKLLWGLGRQGVHCTECGYNCHTQCSDMVIQCRPQRRVSPDSLSITDSEAESVSKYSMHSYKDRYTIDDNTSTSSKKFSTPPPMNITRSLSSSKIEEPLKSPTLYSTNNISTSELINNHQRSKASLNKAYRKSLKQQLQKQQTLKYGSDSELLSPHATAKAFTRLVARSKAFFYIGECIHDVFYWKNKPTSTFVCIFWVSLCITPKTLLLVPPLLVGLLYYKAGITNSEQNASQVLFPRFDENTKEYYTNLETMQYVFTFFIRLYDNLVYHIQHISLTESTYRILFVISLFISTAFHFMGRWLVMAIGLLILLNRTWVGTTAEALLQFLFEVLQTLVDLSQKFKSSHKKIERKPMEISVYENQRWWPGNGYAPQLLRSERSAWSNITGLEPLPPKNEMPPPAHYTWANDDDWHLDKIGPWADDALEIVTLIECDEDGWVYSDHKWSNPQSEAIHNNNESTRALTRRRRWYRKAVPVDEKATLEKKQV